MKAAKRPDRPRYRDVVLDEINGDAGIGQSALAVGLAKKAAIVLQALRLQDQDAGQGCRYDIHGIHGEF